MSIIEKAMRRVSTSSPSQSGSRIRAAARAKEQGLPAAGARGDALEQALADSRPPLALDETLLKRAGVIAPDDEGLRVNDEFRRVKRPLLVNAARKGADAIERGNMIMVTSSIAGEGKTHTAINLALNVARELDHTVLLVDADIIKRTTSEVLGVADRFGLLDLLRDGGEDVGRSLLRTNMPRLTVLPAGGYHPNATELLSSHTMERLVGELSRRYVERIIILDSPPLLATVEAQVLADLAGQIVVVVEACRTPPSVVEEAIATLDRSKPIGLVLNKSRRSLTADYYGGYYKRQT